MPTAHPDASATDAPPPPAQPDREAHLTRACELLMTVQQTGDADATAAHAAARAFAEPAAVRGWHDVWAIVEHGVLLSSQLRGWADAGVVARFVERAHVADDPLAVALSLVTRAEARRSRGGEAAAVDDLVGAHDAAEHVADPLRHGIALHEVGVGLMSMELWELATELFDRSAALTCAADPVSAMRAARVMNQALALLVRTALAREQGDDAAVAELAGAALRRLPAADAAALPDDWRQIRDVMTGVCAVLARAAGPDQLVARTTGLPDQLHVANMLRLAHSAVGWHHADRGDWAAAEPAILAGADREDGPAHETWSFRSWMRVRLLARDLTPDARHLLERDRAELLAHRTHARLALLESVRARLESGRLRAERDRFHRESMTDAMTGLGNRRAFDERMRSATEGTALVVLDLDDFKAINDTHGHAVGDAVLRTVADLLGAGVRADDLAARLGGDEFVIVLGVADDAVARRRAEAIRDAVRDHDWRAVDADLVVTASVGVARGHEDPEALYRAADHALYDAKRAGRGLVRATPARGG